MKLKRVFSVVLCVLLAASLCGCGELGSLELPPLPTVTAEVITDALPEQADQPESAPGSDTAETPQECFNIVKIEHTERIAYDPQNQSELILSFSYDKPVVYIEGKREISAAINEYSAMQSESYYTGDSYGEGYGTGYMNMLTAAEDNYNYIVSSGAEGVPQEYVSDRRLSVERSDEQVLTLVYDNYLYMGGAHGASARRGYSFDLASGEPLRLEDLAEDYTALSSFLVDYMVNTAENDPELAARIDLLPEDMGFADAFSALLRDGSWYLGRDGLVIFSDEYEISTYASGPVYFTVPYEELSGVMRQEWIPTPVSLTGSFEALSPAELPSGSTFIVDMLATEEEGEELYLKAKGDVYDVCVSGVEYSESFYNTGNLWYCSHMKDSALQLITVIPDGLPELQLTWRDAAGEHSVYLSQSGEDGSYLLVEDEIKAVG